MEEYITDESDSKSVHSDIQSEGSNDTTRTSSEIDSSKLEEFNIKLDIILGQKIPSYFELKDLHSIYCKSMSLQCEYRDKNDIGCVKLGYLYKEIDSKRARLCKQHYSNAKNINQTKAKNICEYVSRNKVKCNRKSTQLYQSQFRCSIHKDKESDNDKIMPRCKYLYFIGKDNEHECEIPAYYMNAIDNEPRCKPHIELSNKIVKERSFIKIAKEKISSDVFVDIFENGTDDSYVDLLKTIIPEKKMKIINKNKSYVYDDNSKCWEFYNLEGLTKLVKHTLKTILNTKLEILVVTMNTDIDTYEAKVMEFENKKALYTTKEDIEDFNELLKKKDSEIYNMNKEKKRLEKLVATHKTTINLCKSSINDVRKSNKLRTIINMVVTEYSDENILKKLNQIACFYPIKGGKIVDLRTGDIRERCEQDYFTFEVPVSLLTIDRNDERLEKVDEVFAQMAREDKLEKEEQTLKEFIRVVFGSCLTGEFVRYLYILYGPKGKGGKSSAVQMFQSISGPLCRPVDNNMITGTNKSSAGAPNPQEIMAKNLRCMVFGEVDTTDSLNSSKVKSKFGKDLANARTLYTEDYQDFVNNAKGILPMNKMTRYNHYDGPLRDRLMVIPCYARYVEEILGKLLKNGEYIKDINYIDNLISEMRSEIFTWFVIGAIDFYNNGCDLENIIPDIVRNETEKMHLHGNHIKQFCQVLFTGDDTKKGEFYSVKEFYDAFAEYYKEVNNVQYSIKLDTIRSDLLEELDEFVEDNDDLSKIKIFGKIGKKDTNKDDKPKPKKRDSILKKKKPSDEPKHKKRVIRNEKDMLKDSDDSDSDISEKDKCGKCMICANCGYFPVDDEFCKKCFIQLYSMKNGYICNHKNEKQESPKAEAIHRILVPSQTSLEKDKDDKSIKETETKDLLNNLKKNNLSNKPRLELSMYPFVENKYNNGKAEEIKQSKQEESTEIEIKPKKLIPIKKRIIKKVSNKTSSDEENDED